MRKIHDVLRLHAVGLSKRRIAVGLNIGRTAVGDYLRRARRAGLAWPLPEGLSDAKRWNGFYSRRRRCFRPIAGRFPTGRCCIAS